MHHSNYEFISNRRPDGAQKRNPFTPQSRDGPLDSGLSCLSLLAKFFKKPGDYEQLRHRHGAPTEVADNIAQFIASSGDTNGPLGEARAAYGGLSKDHCIPTQIAYHVTP